MRKIVKIEGMSCGHCAMRVKAALQAVAGVTGVEVDLIAKRAMVEGGELYGPRLKAAVVGAGYRVSGII